MKPYGQKQQKAKHHYKCGHPECVICTTTGWKTSKSRTRKNNHEELNLSAPEDTTLSYEDFECMVVVEDFENKDEQQLFRAVYHPLDIETIGYTPEHALDKVYYEFELIKNQI